MTIDDAEAIVARAQECFAAGMVFFTRHARVEMAEEVILVEEIGEAISERCAD